MRTELTAFLDPNRLDRTTPVAHQPEPEPTVSILDELGIDELDIDELDVDAFDVDELDIDELDHDELADGTPMVIDAITEAGRARCADGNGTLTPLFFSDHLVDIARAKAICSKCDLRERCLNGALERQEPWGVWGGELLSGGRIVAVKRPCGRPPKHPRPEVRVDEMGDVVEAGLGVAVA